MAASYERPRHPCPHCAAPDQPIHDRLSRDWQHLHFEKALGWNTPIEAYQQAERVALRT